MQGHSKPILEPSRIYESHKHPGKQYGHFPDQKAEGMIQLLLLVH